MECTANLSLNLNLYLDELSRVLFKKENLKTRDGTGSLLSTVSAFNPQSEKLCVKWPGMIVGMMELRRQP